MAKKNIEKVDYTPLEDVNNELPTQRFSDGEAKDLQDKLVAGVSEGIADINALLEKLQCHTETESLSSFFAEHKDEGEEKKREIEKRFKEWKEQNLTKCRIAVGVLNLICSEGLLSNLSASEKENIKSSRADVEEQLEKLHVLSEGKDVEQSRDASQEEPESISSKANEQELARKHVKQAESAGFNHCASLKEYLIHTIHVVILFLEGHTEGCTKEEISYHLNEHGCTIPMEEIEPIMHKLSGVFQEVGDCMEKKWRLKY